MKVIVMAKPFDLLNELVGKNAVIGLKGNKEVRGKIVAFDIHMNLYLSSAKVSLEEGSKEVPKIFLRGDSVVYIHPEE